MHEFGIHLYSPRGDFRKFESDLRSLRSVRVHARDVVPAGRVHRGLGDGRVLDLECSVPSMMHCTPVLNAIARFNAAFAHPHPYDSGVVYRSERSEVFRCASIARARGHEDCDSLTSYLAGWYLRGGERASVFIENQPGGGAHAMVRVGRRVEDPSAELGMPT